MRWWKYFGTSDDYQYLSDILFTSQKTVVTCGSETNGYISGKSNTGWLICSDTLGNIKWERRYVLEETRTFGSFFRKFTQTPDGGFCMIGEMLPVDNSNFQDIWIMKTDSLGCLIPGCGLYNYISILTGINEAPSVETLKILLHCSVEKLHLFPLRDDKFTSYRYAIHPMDGKMLLHGDITPGGEIDVHELIQGMYVFTLTDETGHLVGSAKFWKP